MSWWYKLSGQAKRDAARLKELMERAGLSETEYKEYQELVIRLVEKS